eukprot:COSAG04_NODE_1347_length_7134_cov_4.146695_7_plen_67_part_00
MPDVTDLLPDMPIYAAAVPVGGGGFAEGVPPEPEPEPEPVSVRSLSHPEREEFETDLFALPSASQT